MSRFRGWLWPGSVGLTGLIIGCLIGCFLSGFTGLRHTSRPVQPELARPSACPPAHNTSRASGTNQTSVMETSTFQDLFGVFILVSTKQQHYRALIESLVRSDLPRQTAIFISHDVPHEAGMLGLSRELRLTFPRTQMVTHAYSCHDSASANLLRNKEGQFPANWKLACLKNHWLWAMGRVWATFPRLQWLLYLEEDFIVAKHVFRLQRQLAKEALGAGFFGTMLQYRENLWTVSGAMKRSTWETVLRYKDFYCNFNELHWDLTLKQTFLHHPETNGIRYVYAKPDMAFHLGIHGKGFTHGSDIADLAELQRRLDKSAHDFYAATDNVFMLQSGVAHLHTPNEGLGGFDPHFREHCLHLLSWYEAQDTSSWALQAE